jgi:TPR repeat protein
MGGCAQSKTEAKKYLILSAAQGNALAQHDLAMLLVDEFGDSYGDADAGAGAGADADADDTNDLQEALHLYTLSLLQGYEESIHSISKLFIAQADKESDTLKRAYHYGSALYWLRTSNHNSQTCSSDNYGGGHHHYHSNINMARGQMMLGKVLLLNARNTYGLDSYTRSGFNVVPEALYWYRTSAFNGELDAGTRLKNLHCRYLKKCSYCQNVKKDTDNSNAQQEQKQQQIIMIKCSRCSGASYCSSECQQKDWEAGHKFDCYSGPSNKHGACAGIGVSVSVAEEHVVKLQIVRLLV